MKYEGICHKMHTHLGETVERPDGTLAAQVDYQLALPPFACPVSDWLGRSIRLHWTGAIRCVSCGAGTKKSYSQGHCFKCFKTRAHCDLCMVKPDTCHHHLGTCREPDWALGYCFNPHIVYLANSSGLKVGLTRHSQMPTRWLDQGARQAIPVMQTGSRRLAGIVENLFAQHMADKTDWRALLRGEAETLDLQALREALQAQHGAAIEQLRAVYPDEELSWLSGEPVREFAYPVLQYPKKITSLSLDSTPMLEGTLQGIKGQYLLLDTGVINLRKFSGYQIELEVLD